jgi:gliding motility-associated-like protein
VKKIISLRFAGSWFMPILCLLAFSTLYAGGVKDVAPTAADAPVLLETGREGFNRFADYGGPAEGRLYISIGRADEVLYLGLAPEYSNDGVPFSNTISSRYQFRIRKDNPGETDPIVHGPFTLTNLNANVNSYAEAEFGVYDTTQQVGGEFMYVFRPGEAGDYYIEFDDVSADGDRRVNIPFWDFTVVREEQPIEGRVWSRGWAFRTPQVTGTAPPDCVWDREFNGKLYSYTEDGFVSLIDFEGAGFQGLSFNIAFNSSGPGTTGDLAGDRKSVPGANATGNARQHRIFLSLPDIELFPDGVCGQVVAGESFICGGVEPYCLEVEVSRPGQVDILLDFNGNGVLDDNSTDVTLVYEFSADSLSTCIPWNGLRGDETEVDFTDTVDVYIIYAQGVQHWSAYDVEFMKNGFCVETIRPTCDQTISSNVLYYDDRDILEDPGTGAIKDNRDGCICDDNCRTWDYFQLNPGGTCDTFDDDETMGYGDKNTLNTWWFANSRSQFRARVPVISANISGPNNICEGTTAILRASDLGVVGTPAFIWEGQGVDGSTSDSILVTAAGEYCVTIIDPTGCSNRTCRILTVTEFDSINLPGELNICFGEAIQLPVAGNPSYTYLWSPSTGIDNVSSNQPTFTPTDSTTYTVTITNESSDGMVCETSSQVSVNVAPDINLQVIGGGPICDPTTTFTATTAVDTDIVMFDASGTQVGTGNTYTVDVSGETDYLLIATDAQNCIDSIIFSVSGGPVDITVQDTVLTCLSDGVSLTVNNLDANDVLTYSWTPANLFDPATVNNANPVFIGIPGDYIATVVATNQYNCSVTEDVQIILIDDTGTLAFDAAVDCDGLSVDFSNTSTVTFGYHYDFGDGTTSTETSPTHVYMTPGTYTVTLSLIYDQNCVISATREVTTFDAVLVADMEISLGDCDNGSAILNFTDNSLNATGVELTYNWTFTGVTPATSMEANPSVTVDGSGTVTASLVVTSADDCTSTLDTSITVDLAVVNLADEIIICPGASTALNPGSNPELTYVWSPAPDFGANEVNPTTSVPGQYIVTVTNDAADFNCANTDTVTVIQADSIRLVISGPDGPVSGGGVIELPTIATCGNPVDVSADITTNTDVDITYTDLNGNILGTGGTFTLNPDGRDTVVVTAVNQFGCLERDTVVLINNQVNAAIDVNADGLNFCSATDTIVRIINNDLNDTLTYVWEPNDIITGPLNGETVDITSPDLGSVDLMVTVSNQLGCDTMITVTILAIPFTPNEYEDIIQPCFTDQFTINGGPVVEGYIYEWAPTDNLDLTDPANPVGTFEDDGTLMVTITDPATGCTSTQEITVDVSPEISFMVMPQDTSLCGPGNVTINGRSVNDNVEIIWFSDPELTNQVGTGVSYIVEASDPGQTYTVYGQATDPSSGCTQVIPVTVSVIPFTPNEYEDIIQPCFTDQFTINGGPAVEGYIYEWAPADNLDLTDPANPVGTFENDGTLMVTITDPATGCTSTQEIAVDVSPEISFMVMPQDTTLCGPGNVTINGSSVNENVEIIWFSDPELTNQVGTGASYIVEASEAGQTYTVYGQATDPSSGCTQVIPVTVSVIPFTPNEYEDIIQPCFTDQFTINGGPAVEGYTYEWAPAGNLDLTDPANPVGTFENDATLMVTITDPATGCTSTQEITVDVSPEISFMVMPQDTALCGPGNVTINGSSVNENVEIVWFSDPELTNQVGTGASYVIEASEPGQTTVYGQATDPSSGCTQLIPVTVSIIPFTPNEYDDVIQPCFKDQFSVNGGSAIEGYVYEWAPSDNLDLTDPANPVGTFEDDGTLTVTITDPATGCTSTQEITVDVSPEISFMAMPQDTTLCAPANVTINGSSVNENVEIVWFSDPALTNQVGTGASYVIEASEPGQTYIVYGLATEPSSSCTQVIPVTVIVSELTAGLPLDAVATCLDQTPSIFGPDGPSGNLNYTYEPAGAIDDSNPLDPVFIGNGSTVVTITATDPATGCSIMREINITVENFAGVTGMADPADIFLGESTTLTVEGCADCTYEWFPPNGTVTPNTGATVTATPDEDGTLIYEVEVSRGGCMQILEIEVRVEDPLCDVEHIFVPNTFTPNGDNQNDVMQVRTNFADQISEFRFIIFNRWGQEVYASDDIFETWDGTTEGDDLEPDVYGYWLRVVCPAGQELIQQGNISIIR